jgi:putative oxidoreductase
MERWLGRFSGPVYALTRFVVGLTFACHGGQKLFGFPGGQVMTDKPLMLLAGIIGFGGGLLIALGLFAGFAAFVACGEMAYAYFVVHTPGGFWPILNKGELAIVYCLVFFYVASRGSGPISLDRLFGTGGK